MKFLKNNLKAIIAFILGVILASSITVYAYSYIASDVKYTKKDGTEISVADALNDLYHKGNLSSKNFQKFDLGEVTYSFSSGTYSKYSSTKTIDVKELLPSDYASLTEDNFSYEITGVHVGSGSGGYVQSSLGDTEDNSTDKPLLNYDKENGILSLTIYVNNGREDYIKSVYVKLYAFTSNE